LLEDGHPGFDGFVNVDVNVDVDVDVNIGVNVNACDRGDVRSKRGIERQNIGVV